MKISGVPAIVWASMYDWKGGKAPTDEELKEVKEDLQKKEETKDDQGGGVAVSIWC